MGPLMSTGPVQMSRGRRLAAPALLSVAALCALSPLVGWADGPGGEPAVAPTPAAVGGTGPVGGVPLPPIAPATPAAPGVSAPSSAPGATAAAPAAPAAGDPGAPRPDALRDVDRRIGDLKDQIFRAKARLSLLSEKHLRSAEGGVPTTVTQRNQLGVLYRPVRVVYEIDGREVFRREDSPQNPIPGGELAVWDGTLRPGEHTLSATLLYRGNGNRVLSYYDEYTYTVSAAHRFTVTDGAGTRIRVLCREKGNFVTTAVENRPFIEFQVEDPSARKPAAEKGADAAR
jgi:hypothetical protein